MTTTLSRTIEERRTVEVTFDEPRKYHGAPRKGVFVATGYRVVQRVDTPSRGERRAGFVLDGHRVNRDGSPSKARGAENSISVNPDPRARGYGYGLNWSIAPEHHDELVKLAQAALDEFAAIDWEKVNA